LDSFHLETNAYRGMPTMRKVLLLGFAPLLLVSAVVGTASTAQYVDGMVAFVNGDYTTAAGIWRGLADKGEASSQVSLGSLYKDGKGVKQDYNQAIKWYRKAAEQSDVSGQVKLGEMYDLGLGVQQDSGVAAGWYRRAADNGDADAQFYLCSGYVGGQGLPQDLVQAYKWCTLALYGFPAREKRKTDKVIAFHDKLLALLTPVQFAEAQKQINEWKPTSMGAGQTSFNSSDRSPTYLTRAPATQENGSPPTGAIEVQAEQETQAFARTAAGLLHNCTSDSLSERFACYDYLLGVVDTILTVQETLNDLTKSDPHNPARRLLLIGCWPGKGVDALALSSAYVAWAARNPGAMNWPRRQGAFGMILQQYPCR
jgi:uncharacterized protein